ncbi:hypothetical protein COCNU_scaffold008996G000010 [Cocos nucifera]|nr:hypothetical protein [Cocos nucifera]
MVCSNCKAVGHRVEACPVQELKVTTMWVERQKVLVVIPKRLGKMLKLAMTRKLIKRMKGEQLRRKKEIWAGIT